MKIVLKTNMYFPSQRTANTVPTLLPLLIYLLFKCFIGVAATNNSQIISIGAIIDVNSHTGQEQKKAMEISVQNFNNHSKTHNIILHFRDSGKNPFQAASLGELFYLLWLIIFENFSFVCCNYSLKFLLLLISS